jgi:tetratricopeptide (TPR) repeat protein
MALTLDDESITRRKLILRDTAAFLTLVSITVVLFAITLFLFRSFASHREELAQRWSTRGREAIASGHPDQAVVALRTALSYAPGERSNELLLAQALGDAGHTEESYNYFLGLWETQPGDGFINLQLARLSALKKEMQAAINYYRASIYGTWEGDGVVRRRQVRLELSRYLIAHHDLGSARTELLIAGGNAPDNLDLDLVLAPLLEQAGAPHDALTYYRKILTFDPNNQTALQAAGQLEYTFGRFDEAHRLLEQAAHHQNDSAANEPSLPPALATMMDDAARIMAIDPSKKLAPQERVARILHARELAKRRFMSCSAPSTAANPPLAARWTSKEATTDRTTLLHTPEIQDAAISLVYDTEMQTSQSCGAPTGDDALLLQLAKTPKAVEP